jgi:hypothetical protein
LPTGFTIAALFRSRPRATLTPPGNGFICGNNQPVSTLPADFRGWALEQQQDEADTDYSVRLRYGTGPLSSSASLLLATSAMKFHRTMLVHVFFGVISTRDEGDPQVIMAVNGNIIPPFPVSIAGYVPADATNPFRIGSGPIGAPPDPFFPAPADIAGFAFLDSAPQSPGSDAAIEVCRDRAAAHFNQVQRAQDMVSEGFPELTDVYSVRRRLRQPAASWPAVVGSTSLARQGSASLRTDASEPHFLDNRWQIAL